MYVKTVKWIPVKLNSVLSCINRNKVSRKAVAGDSILGTLFSEEHTRSRLAQRKVQHSSPQVKSWGAPGNRGHKRESTAVFQNQKLSRATQQLPWAVTAKGLCHLTETPWAKMRSRIQIYFSFYRGVYTVYYVMLQGH